MKLLDQLVEDVQKSQKRKQDLLRAQQMKNATSPKQKIQTLKN